VPKYIPRTPVRKVTEDQLPIFRVKFSNQREISSSVRSKLTPSSSPISLQHLVDHRHQETFYTCSFPFYTKAFHHEMHSYREGSFKLNPEKENNVARKKVRDDAHHLWSLWGPEGIKSKRNPIK
jgi:hypothetical protein